MRSLLNVSGWMGAAAALAMVSACGEPSRIDEPGKSLQAQKRDPTYPDGPYGYSLDNVIADFKLFGRTDVNNSGSVADDVSTDLWLSDFRKDKDGNANKVIVVTASAEWCGPCNAEQPDLVAMYDNYTKANAGVVFLEAVVEDSKHQPSDDATVDRWAKKHGIPFPLGLDPGMSLQKYYDVNAFPFGMVIRVSDMKIVWQGNGAAPDAIKKNIEFLLNEEG